MRQPRPADIRMSLHRALRHPQHLPRLPARQPAEKPQLDDPVGLGVDGLQFAHGVMKIKDERGISTDRVPHAVVSSEPDAEEVMKHFKAWCSRRLSDAAALGEPIAKRAGRRRWFTEGGNCSVIENDHYLHNAIRYVLQGQSQEMHGR